MINVIVVFFIVAVIVLSGYFYFRNKALEDIRSDVYQLFLQAEHTFTQTGAGKQKMKWVISKARSLLPNWAQVFITEDFLEKVVEGWFRAVKDLLDDGKINGTGKGK